MSDTLIRKLQLAQLGLLKEVDRVCKKNGLKYYMIAGTALGAVRHKGFIPWDIDLDVAMMREDYEKLMNECSADFGEEFFFQNYRTEKQHYSAHACLCLNDSEIKFSTSTIVGEVKKHSGIYIDIFPLDTAPDDVKLQNKQLKKIRFYKKIKNLKKNCKNMKGFLRCKWIAHDLIKLALAPFTFRFLNKRQDKAMRKYNGCNSGLVASMASKYSYKKQLMPISVYGEPSRIWFEDGEYCVPANIEFYLKKIYGNYMKLPPENERESLMKLIAEVRFPENKKDI